MEESPMSRISTSAACVVLVFLVVAAGARGQSTNQFDSPKAVVEHLFQMAVDGTLLSPDGWSKTGVLFVKPEQLQLTKGVTVISDDYSINQWSIAGKHATVYAGYDYLGDIDARLRYKPSDERTEKWATIYHLTLTEAQLPPYASRSTAEPQAYSAWKIDNPQGGAWAGVHAAIRYVKQARDESTDPVVKKNADATIAILSQLE